MADEPVESAQLPQSAEAAREEQRRRDAGRGCLLFLILDLAALLGGALFGLATLLEWRALRSAGAFAFIAFTIAAVLAAAWTSLSARRRRDK